MRRAAAVKDDESDPAGLWPLNTTQERFPIGSFDMSAARPLTRNLMTRGMLFR
jgi:hypothetical protein